MRRAYHRGRHGRCAPHRNLALALGLFVYSAACGAGDWTVEPRIKLAEIYSDNLSLSASDKQRDAVTQVAPGVNVQGKSARSQFNLDYGLQSLTYANDSSRNTVYHNLNANAREQLVREKVFLGATAAIGQRIIDPAQFVLTDTITPGNRTNVVSYSVTPEVHDNIGGAVDADLKYRYGQVNYLDTDMASDSTLSDARVGLRSARHGRVSWGLDYTKTVTDRRSAPQTSLESGAASLRVGLSDHWAALAVGGREHNDTTWAKATENGSYWRAGLSWSAARASVQASYGDRSKAVSLFWSPMIRTSLRIAYVDQSIGVNPGPTWSGEFRHRTRHTTWQLGYVDEVTNLQIQDINGYKQTIFDVLLGLKDPSEIPPSIPLINNDFIRKRSNAGVSLNTAFTVAGINLFYETREYQVTPASEADRGAALRLAGREPYAVAAACQMADAGSFRGRRQRPQLQHQRGNGAQNGAGSDRYRELRARRAQRRRSSARLRGEPRHPGSEQEILR